MKTLIVVIIISVMSVAYCAYRQGATIVQHDKEAAMLQSLER